MPRHMALAQKTELKEAQIECENSHTLFSLMRTMSMLLVVYPPSATLPQTVLKLMLIYLPLG